MTAKLVGEEGLLKGHELLFLEGEEWIIGRDPAESSLIIEDPTASRKHAICRKTPEGFTLENLSSTNPVKVNDEELKEPRTLQQGDKVMIGSVLYSFYQGTNAGKKEKEAEKTTKAKKMMNTDEDMEFGERESIFEEEAHEGPDIAHIEFEPENAGRFLLKVISGPNNGAQVSLQPDTSYVIGTDPATSDIVFHDASVSRQHARLAITEDGSILIEDLKSKNGTNLESGPIQGKIKIATNAIVTVGTTSFVVFDRDEDRQTIISPLLPSIVNTLKKEAEQKTEKTDIQQVASTPLPAEEPKKEGILHLKSRVILIGILGTLFLVIGYAATSLFRAEEVIPKSIDVTLELKKALTPFSPHVQYSFNKATGRLLLVGHVESPADKNQIEYDLQGLPFIKSVDDSGVIIDEYVWQETNQVIGKNPRWRGVAVQSPKPGVFVLTGYLQTRKQWEELSDYMTQNFPYVDLLEKKVIVEEELGGKINNILEKAGLKNIDIKVSSGQVTLSGSTPYGQASDITRVIGQIKEIAGVRSVRNLILSQEPEQSIINLSDLYQVSGYSNLAGGTINVVINGKILSRGDVLDGMTITSIRPNVIFLEKGGIKYRIDYNK